MIQQFTDIHQKHTADLREALVGFSGSYENLVRLVVRFLSEYGADVDPLRVTEVDYGDYQGTQVYVIGAAGYQPQQHFVVAVSYGSCSACDSLYGALEEAEPDRTTSLFALATHIIQGIKEI